MANLTIMLIDPEVMGKCCKLNCHKQSVLLRLHQLILRYKYIGCTI